MMENIFIVPAMQHGNRAKPIKHCNKIWEIREWNFLISRVVMELYNFVTKPGKMKELGQKLKSWTILVCNYDAATPKIMDI